ncbi:MAG: carbon-nitrogen hydrolase family protein [Bryobacteraceae bacterium]
MLALLLLGAVSNLLPPPAAWTSWSPRPAIAAEATRTNDTLSLRARTETSVGTWSAQTPVTGGLTYRFEVACRPDRVGNSTAISAILSWFEGDRLLRRDYAEPEAGSLARTLEAPAQATLAKVELGLRWTTGAVEFRNATLTEAPKLQHRIARLVTTRLRRLPSETTVEANMKRLGDLLDRAAKERPDLVLLSEIAPQYGVPGTPLEVSQSIPGPITESLAAKARQHHTWIATSMFERVGDEVYNTGILLDREGRVAGKYRKVHLPLSEVEAGISAGTEFPVFQTDFGKVGLLICWDNSFPEAARTLRLKGAEILLLPIMGDPSPHWDVITRARAIDNGMFVAASMDQEYPSRIVAPDGSVLAETVAPAGIAVAEIDLDQQNGVYWLSVGPGLGEPKSLYIRERRPETYAPLVR